jgi:uncharacterized protein DUF1194
MRDRFAARPRLTRRCGIAAVTLLGLLATVPARAQSAVDLQLVLAVDASGSVDMSRFELQKRGYAAAFRNRQVLDAIRSGPAAAISVTMVQWTGPSLHVQVVPWTLLKDEATTTELAAIIDAAPRRLFGGGTSISGAIDHGMTLFRASPFEGKRRTIDVSGDGSNNSGRSVIRARDEAVASDVVINGLPILAIEPDLDLYYKDNVIGGPGAFVIAAQSFDNFADAILKKLIIEISRDERRPQLAERLGLAATGKRKYR